MICRELLKFRTKPSKETKAAIRYAIDNSYKSMRIEGRGTVYVDPCEVRRHMEKENLFERAEKIINSK